jgi:hypothetical protein
MIKQAAAAALSALALLSSPTVWARAEEPFGPNIGPWWFTQATQSGVDVCRAMYQIGNFHVRFGRFANGHNWINMPGSLPKGKVTGAQLVVGQARQVIDHPLTRSDGQRLWLEAVTPAMLDQIAKARGFEVRVGNYRDTVQLDGNAAAAFKRLGECFVANGGSATPAAKAAPAKARMLYPDYPGASQTCLIPIDPDTRRYKVAEGSQLVLSLATSGAQCSVFVVSRQRITLAGKPNLCVNVGASARAGFAYLEACKDVSVTGWDIAATSTTSSRIRAVGGPHNNTCFALPQIADERVKMPVVELQPCKANAAQDMKFFLE